MLSAWSTATDADHQADSDVRKAVSHVTRNGRGRGYPVLPLGQTGDDYIVFPNPAQCVIVVVMSGHILWAFVLFVEENSCGNALGADCTYPADSVILRIGHPHRRNTMEAGR